MRITVIGTGYVGLVTGVCLAEMGNDVVCTVRDNKKRSKLKRGVPTIYEQGLAELLKRNLREDRLRFTGNVASAIRQGEIIFIAVGTPMKKDGSADLSAVHDVADQIGASLKAPAVIAMKSTVPVGTSRIVKQRIARRAKVPFTMASNPEFLSQGRAVRDFLVPNRIIIGVEDPATEATLRELYRPLVRAQQPLLVTTIPSAELMKYASNAFLATKISYMNDLANYAERVGADITEVAKGMGLDDRIGPKFLHAGIGYGGSCFPKDVQALVEDAARHKTPLHILPAVATVNEQQRTRFLHKLRSIYPDLSGKRIAVWGLTFKPKTDDLRDAPSVTIITSLLQAG
ncbi:MAG: UDP-glucose/GDP-mannose dehydrogenase family protein, partial [Candidatus Kerfeldbacteria bacterium]|nr:UDP-glucose/GDP-mannose dehydrogenase family protein [Candidatus Kerfeldbacteria bacterium]